jgi:hypothetical protein
MTLHIALTGSGGTGKTTLSEWISEQISNSPDIADSEEVITLTSATRYIADLFDLDVAEQGTSHLSLYSAIQRRFWMAKYAHENSVILSERCCLDELAYQMWHVRDLQRSLEENYGTLSDEGIRIREVEIAFAMSVQFILYHQSLDDALNYWDFIYYKPPLKSVEIENDGVRSIDEKYRDEIDQIMFDLIIELIREVPMTSDKIRVLPPDLDDSKRFLTEEFENWMTTFNS